MHIKKALSLSALVLVCLVRNWLMRGQDLNL